MDPNKAFPVACPPLRTRGKMLDIKGYAAPRSLWPTGFGDRL